MRRELSEKLTNLTLVTTLTVVSLVSPLTTYALENGLINSKEVFESVKNQEAIDQLEIGQTIEMNEKRDVVLEDLGVNNSIKLTESTFDLAEWSYSEEGESILLRKYIGQRTQIEIPGEYNGKQIILRDLKLFPSTMTELVIKEVNGKKVKLRTDWLYASFEDNKTIRRMDLRGLDTSNVTSMSRMFEETNLAWLDLRGLDTSNVTNMSRMFHNSSRLSVLNLSSFDTSNVTDMSHMFSGMGSLTDLDLSSFDTSKVTTMRGMFSGASSLTSLDLSHFDTTNVKNMLSMFSSMASLKSLNLSGFDTSNVTDMSHMFQFSYSISSLDLSSFNTAKVTDMSYMFYDADSLTDLDLSSFDTSNVIDMNYMFGSMNRLMMLDLSSFKISDQANIEDLLTCGVFSGCQPNLILIAQDDALISKLKLISTDRVFQFFKYPLITSSTTIVSGEGIPGATIGVFSEDGRRLAYGTVNKNGIYELTIPKQSYGSIVKIKMAKSGYKEAWKKIRVMKGFDVFTYNTPTISSTTISGKGVPGAKVGVYTSNGKRLAITTVNSNGNYKLTIPKQKAGTVLTLKQAKSGYLTVAKELTVLKEFKTFTIKKVSASSVAIYGTGEPGANVKAFVNGKAISSLTKVNSKGNYKLVIPKQKAGTVVQIKMAKDGYKTISQTTTILNEFKTFTYTTPNTSSMTISGKGVPGAKVGVYTSNGKRLAITTVNRNGNYKLTIPKQKGGTVLTLKQAESGYLTVAKELTVLKEFKTFTIKKVSTSSVAIYGTGEPGAQVRAFVNGKAISSLTKVNSKGNYKLVIPKQKAGTIVEVKMANNGYQTISKTVKVLKG